MSKEQEKQNSENYKEQLDQEMNDVMQNEAEDNQAEADKESNQEISELDNLRNDLQEEKEKFLRLFAEFENYKRRTSKERIELFKTAGEEIMQVMLPVLDDFDRALKEIQKSEDENMLKGVELISNKLRRTLESKGLAPIAVKAGDKFDADLHEAVTQIPAPDKKLKGKVIDVVETGYTLGDKIIRYPKVVTGK
ncbi:nucleotide exchange factor GrpE [Mesonia sp. HuA40]|uniref:nucleotide exchange factor GrpE n=1 Tax=Mesonia sp. HuA40 TaxID=2602761 RepID=UPI0011C93205|nr:nucleotide exchange factor GrpE [Mesonia sp. HuA40]TXK73548.1 nucleotide exchange factor GrpE [Mesonia sp. HuA40]